MVTRSESPRGPEEIVYCRGCRSPPGRSTAIATYWPVRCPGVLPSTGARTSEKISGLWSIRSTTRYLRHGCSGSVPPERVETALLGDELAAEEPVDLVPGGRDLGGDGVAEDVADGPHGGGRRSGTRRT